MIEIIVLYERLWIFSHPFLGLKYRKYLPRHLYFIFGVCLIFKLYTFFICRNVTDHPTEEKYRTLRKENKAFKDKVWRYEGCQQFLFSTGWIEVNDYFSLYIIVLTYRYVLGVNYYIVYIPVWVSNHIHVVSMLL